MYKTSLFTAIGDSNGSVIKSGYSDLFNVTCVNLNANTRYLQLFDKTSLPLSGEKPKYSYPVYGLSGVSDLSSLELGDYGLPFAVGLSWGFSSTPLTYTPANAVDNMTYIRYI
jgi:hypothetical protein